MRWVRLPFHRFLKFTDEPIPVPGGNETLILVKVVGFGISDPVRSAGFNKGTQNIIEL